MKRHRRPPFALALASAALLASAAVFAGVDCTVTASGPAFGTYDPTLSADDDSTGSVTVTCNYISPGSVADAVYTLALSTGSSGTYAARRMNAGSSQLGYNLFTDAARSQVWGNATGGSAVISGTLRVGPGVGNGTRSQTYTVYGRVPALQDADTGSYSDSILVTLTF